LMGVPQDRLSESLIITESDQSPKLTLKGKTLSISFDKELPLQHNSQHTFIINNSK